MDAGALGIIALFTGVGLLFTGLILVAGISLLRHERRERTPETQPDSETTRRTAKERERRPKIWIGMAWLLIIIGSIGMFLAASCGAGFLFG